MRRSHTSKAALPDSVPLATGEDPARFALRFKRVNLGRGEVLRRAETVGVGVRDRLIMSGSRQEPLAASLC